MKTVEGKVPYHLLPVEALEAFAWAMQEGADRYEQDDWRQGRGMPWSWLIAAALRHATALQRGEDIDPDSSFALHHGAKLMACGAMLLYYHEHRKVFNKDDRFRIRWPHEPETERLKSTCCNNPRPTLMTRNSPDGDGRHLVRCLHCARSGYEFRSAGEAWTSWNNLYGGGK